MKSTRKTTIRARIMRLLVISLVLMAVPSILLLFLTFLSGNPADMMKIFMRLAPLNMLFVLLVLVGGILIAARVSGKISNSVKDTAKALDELSKGSINVHVDDISNDELGTAAESLNRFTAELRTAVNAIIAYLDGLAAGDLTVKTDYTWLGDWHEINIALDKITTSLNKIFTNVRDASDQAASGSDQVASASQALAQGATEQASAIEQLSATIAEISEHVRKNAASATAADSASTKSAGMLAEADRSMQQMMQAMDAINQSSQKISNIIKTIDDISFQTNILALNAAVEAARAGAAGKGFAVVADEVRNLASKSAEAAKDTTTLIEDSIKAVESGTSVAKVTQQTLLEVKASSADASQLVNEIAAASNQQATSIGQITQGVQQISAVVQTNSATAEQSAAASEELAAQAKNLKRALAALKIAELKQPGARANQAAAPAAQAKPQKAAQEAPAAPSPVSSTGTAAVPVVKSAGKDDKYV